MEGGGGGSRALSGEGSDRDEPVEIAIGEEIDLHAFQPRDVLSVVEAYLDASREKGLLQVRLIHGRGRGVQRAAIHRLLRGRADVAGWEDAAPLSGGWGATSVRFVTPRGPDSASGKQQP